MKPHHTSGRGSKAQRGRSATRWVELSVEAPAEYAEPLSQVFHRFGDGGVAIETAGGHTPDEGETAPLGGRTILKAYLPLDAAFRERRSRIDIGVRLVGHVASLSPLHERVLDEEEWESSWKQHFQPLCLGKKTVICPTWRQCYVGESDIVIKLDPGMAFGTGHHPTTRMCLERLEEEVRPGLRVLDVGCGSGILSIAAAKLGASSVFALDIDSVAVGLARRNVDENGVGQVVTVLLGGLPHPDVRAGSYDIAVANISAKVVSEMARELVSALAPDGHLIASGIIDENRTGVVQQLASAGAQVDCTMADGDWVAMVVSRRHSP